MPIPPDVPPGGAAEPVAPPPPPAAVPAAAPGLVPGADPRSPIVVIAGGLDAVARAVARRFARAGARIAILASGQDRLDAVAREVEACGGHAIAIPTDLADPDAVVWAAGLIEKDVGPIDVWINDAAPTPPAPAEEVAPDEYRRVTEVTYLGTVWGTLAALRGMKPRGRGAIVQVGGALDGGEPGRAAHGAAEHAIRAFTEALRAELRAGGVGIHLARVELATRGASPERAADAVARAARGRRREIFVGSAAARVTRWLAGAGVPIALGALAAAVVVAAARRPARR